MPLTTMDGSSAISESQEIIIFRDGGLCVLCGMDVAYIVAQNDDEVSETD